MDFTVRRAVKSDAPAIARLHVQGWRDAYGGLVAQPWLDGLDEAGRAEKWEGFLEQDHGPVFMAFDQGGAEAGFVNYGRLRTPVPGQSPIRPLYSGEIYALYILSPYWRMGLGTQLMRRAAEGLREMKHKSLCLWVLEGNSRAAGFYKALGGERCGKKDVEIGGATVREICFGWRNAGRLWQDYGS